MYEKNYTNYNQRTFNPKKTVKNFTDLEVYQKALEAGVFTVSIILKTFQEKHPSADIEFAEVEHPASEVEIAEVKPGTKGTKGTEILLQKDQATSAAGRYVIKNMTACALSIPHLIAESHSKRFGTGEECLLILDKVMLNCNKMVVYLEQTRDICETGLEIEQFEEQTKKYFYIRRKVLNLQRVWRKYIKINKDENN